MARIIKSTTFKYTVSEIEWFLIHDQNQHWQRLNAARIKQKVHAFKTWPELSAMTPETAGQRKFVLSQDLVKFFKHELNEGRQRLEVLHDQYVKYSKRFSKTVTNLERRQLILDYAGELGATKKQLQQDNKAFARWFGHDTMTDRYQHRVLSVEQDLHFMLDSLGRLVALAMHLGGNSLGYTRLWERLNIVEVVQPLLAFEGDKRVVTSAFKALSIGLHAIPGELRRECLSDDMLRFIYHACLKSRQSVWVQCEALRLLQQVDNQSMLVVFETRLRHPQADDDLFVRRVVIELLIKEHANNPKYLGLLLEALNDPSPAVRQKIAEEAVCLNLKVIEQLYPHLLQQDETPQVRAQALLGLNALLNRADTHDFALTYLTQRLQNETDKYCLRVALHVVRQSFTGNQLDLDQLIPVIEKLHQQATQYAVRRWAAQVREYLLLTVADNNGQLQSWQAFVDKLKPGQTRRIPKSLLQGDEKQIGRQLALLAQEDFGFDVEHTFVGRFLTRGHVFGFRLWRFFHENRHSSPDKRQAFSHTCGRLFWGRLRVPSGILSELAETKVPGEPLFMSSEDGWRGYLPLVDEVLSALVQGHRPSYFYSSEGVTELVPPKTVWRRWYASWLITWRFADFARLRNWQENSQDPASRYLTQLTKLGLQFRFKGHQNQWLTLSEDPAVLRFFPAMIPGIDDQWLARFKDYFVSVYENSIYELSLFLLMASTFFFGRHVVMHVQINKARKSLPLVLGGWGTRGKSGTERIKAALMNALGYSIISKTTGCEAMFLHAPPFGQLREMFLFRPYDKATIWEQHNLVRLASKMETQVYLWECMGLTPSYVYILQQQWMQDDISTITNTYPDHEDIQGPAGINIPQVMTNFIPKRSVLISSEEQMRPILQASCVEKQTRFRGVGWLEAGLLAPDILARFPYDEHPFNIALVLGMAEELGIDSDFALKEMADRVVPDLGVLKTYPMAIRQSRRLEFINGMSANERFGCMGNWTRMGMDKLDIENQPNIWITSVINNRADRIARSRVFAGIVVKDISFDRCVLIGNNLTGFMGYIKESWAEWIETVNLGEDRNKAIALLQTQALRFRIPYRKELVQQRLRTMLEANGVENCDPFIGVGVDAKHLEELLRQHNVAHAIDVLGYWQKDVDLWLGYQAFKDKLTEESTLLNATLNISFQELLWQWFHSKIVVVENYYATGNEVINVICRATPPGFYCKIMGMQNIKGTGLDFVYRWQAWESCFKACQLLTSNQKSEATQGLRILAAFQEFGYLAQETVRNTINNFSHSAIGQTEFFQAEIEFLLARLDKEMEALNDKNPKQAQTSTNKTVLKPILETLEAFLDAGDAVKRRKRADAIYQDLIDERISHDRAVMELQALNKRQKGGWLKEI